MPHTLISGSHDQAYNIPPRKGTYHNLPLVAWAPIEECIAELCRIDNMCQYVKTTAVKTVKCGLQKSYIQATSEMIHRCFEKELQSDEDLLFKVGMQLMPLYRALCKLKMEELSVSYPVYATPRGDRKADPVYKELRETIKSINQCYRDLGLKGTRASAVPVPKGVSHGYEDELFEEDPEGEKPKLDLGEEE